LGEIMKKSLMRKRELVDSRESLVDSLEN
jgi:hypothetical protein